MKLLYEHCYVFQYKFKDMKNKLSQTVHMWLKSKVTVSIVIRSSSICYYEIMHMQCNYIDQ